MASKPSWMGRLKAALVGDPLPVDGVVKSFNNKDPEAANIIDMMRTHSGSFVNARTAMQLDAVWGCVRLIAESIAMLPLHLYHQDDTNPRPATRHHLYDLLRHSPNSKSTATVFWESVVSAMLLQGNAYILKSFHQNGKIASLTFMAPYRLNIVKDLQGNKRFYYTYDDGQQREVQASRVWQLQGYTLDGRDGVSVLEYAAEVFGTAIAAERSAARTFINGVLQAVYYTVSAFLTDEQRDSFRKNVKGTVERGEAPILEGGVDVKALGINPKDTQLLESRGWSVEAICRWFRVPPSMVGHSEKSTSWGSGIEQQQLGFLTFTLMPWIVRIEQGIGLGLLSAEDRARYYAKFETEQLLRADSKARSEYYASMTSNGNMTRDEVRRREGFALMGGNAAILTVQSAMVGLNSIPTTQAAVPADSPATVVDPLAEAQATLQAYLRNNTGGNTQ